MNAAVFRIAQTHLRTLALLLVCLATHPILAAQPQWIWNAGDGSQPGDDPRFFRKSFQVGSPVKEATLIVSADNYFTAYLNGQSVAKGENWQSPAKVNVTKKLTMGANVLAVAAGNQGGPAGLVAKLEVTLRNGKKMEVVSDPSWRSNTKKIKGWESTKFVLDTSWSRAKGLGNLGVGPWGNVFAAKPNQPAARPQNRQATAADQIKVLPGFEIERIHNATGDEGSWICMTLDPKGRLIISPQNSRQPLIRFTLDAQGQIAKKETIALGIGEAMGLLHAFDSLYANAKGPKGTGIYRLKDTTGDDQYDQAEFLAPMRGGGEHGPHALALGPDNLIYVMNGNHTKVPDNLSDKSPHKDYREDLLLPRDWDGNGHARNVLAPGGYIARMDKDGKNWEFLLAGFRNSYDFAFNGDGEIFTYDSDMEWDWGMPWYRPTVVFHCVSGADYGWRSGTGKWPWYYPDTLPPASIIGIGCPTGVAFGHGAKFPAKYQKALYVMDWTYGRIVAVHLTPDGAGYTGKNEHFVEGRPLNVTDMVVGQDGAMYFATGGRGTQSGLYRVTYSGDQSTAPAQLANDRGARERALRRRLEAFHGRQDSRAVDEAWPHLNHPDRYIRAAARVAIESQPVSTWRYRALEEESIQGSLTALLALARKGSNDVQEDLLTTMGRYWPEKLTDDQKIQALRVAGLSFSRMGPLDEADVGELIEAIDPLYPSSNQDLNHELCQMLVYLGAPSVIEKTLDLMESAPTQEEQIHYLVALRTMNKGWTLEQRRRYFSWFNRSRSAKDHPQHVLQWFKDVKRNYGNGASYNKFIANFKNRAQETLSPQEREQLASILQGKEVVTVKLDVGPRSFVKEWSESDLLPLLGQVNTGRDFKKGRIAYHAAQCVACHKHGNEGGAAGQDLTAVASRYTTRDILDSILHPSKVVSEQYQNTTFYLKNGDDVTGKVVDEQDGKLVVLTDAINNRSTRIAKADVDKQAASTLSPMPEGLINVLSREEILDLIAYLRSGGDPNNEAYR